MANLNLTDENSLTEIFQLTPTTHRQPNPLLLPERPENSQGGKIIVITGGGSGIGAAAAAVWVRAGAAGVVIAGRRQELLESTAKELIALGKCSTILPVKTDVTIAKDVKNLFAEVQKTFGRPADVVLANARYIEGFSKLGEHAVDAFWNEYEINVKGVMSCLHYYIKSLPNPEDPVGTFITVNSGLAGKIQPGLAAYSSGKLAAQRIIEFADAEYPNLRVFTTIPGVVVTEILHPQFLTFAKDHPELTGMLALYLMKPKADYLRGQLVSVNWDVTEMEEHKEEIQSKKSLQISWLPILPASVGKGLKD